MSAPAFAPGTLLMAGLLTALTSSQGLLTTASKTGGAYAYNFAAVPFLAELTKLAISYLLLERQRRADPASVRITRDWRTLALFIVPSIIYMVHNNVQVGLGATGVVHAFPCLLIAMRVGGRTVGRVLAAACCEIDAPAGAVAFPLCRWLTPSWACSPCPALPPVARSSSSCNTWTPPPTRFWATLRL